jgi:hypothetical protein
MDSNVVADTRSIVEAYHRGWTSKRYDDSIRLLAPDLRVEVPINDHPTRDTVAVRAAGLGGHS